MTSEQKNFLKPFAHVSPLFAAAAWLIFASFLPVFAQIAAANDAPSAATTKRDIAEDQFDKAQQDREMLNSKPAEKRSLAEYKQVVSSYRRVYLISPRASSVSDALYTVGDLYSEMGDRFGQSYFQAAVEAYRFLIHEYPTSKHDDDALLKIAALQKDRLNDAAAASKSYQEYLKKYPRSAHRREVQESIAELALLLHGAEPGSQSAKSDDSGGDSSDAADADSAPALPREGGSPRIRRIDTSARADSTLVVIDLEDAVRYTSGRIRKPDRIYFDLHGARLTPDVARASIHIEGNLLKKVRVAQFRPGVVRVVLDVEGVKDYTASLVNRPPRLLINLAAAKGALLNASNGNLIRDSHPDVTPASAAKPTRDGESTLTRALGLKINRIVIDPGHGGHDTGTIGPSGLMEKDLCLDVALRLGNIIRQRLPGAEVVYTRSDDTFIPLEERTRIANEAKADLFISIHANSSPNKGARGIETYYLNLRGSPEAMEVAARENATSDQGIHDLQGLVRDIARTEKIDESREFAEDVQDSLSKHIFRTAHSSKNRGVRKAPFVVLIGADMPSILTEISFLSNPWDEKQLKRPMERQKVAEGIYQGVADYLQSLNSMTLNKRATPVSAHTRIAGGEEETRNQN